MLIRWAHCRCSTILVRNRERELFCVSCDMFVRLQPEAPAPPGPAPQQTSQPTVSADAVRYLVGQREEQEHQPEAHNSSSKQEDAAVQQSAEELPCKGGPDRVKGLLMESMEVIARELKEILSVKRSWTDAEVEMYTKSITNLTGAYERLAKIAK